MMGAPLGHLPTVHLGRAVNLLHARDRRLVRDFADRFSGRIFGLIVHDQRDMATHVPELMTGLRELDAHLGSVSTPPYVFLEYAAGLEDVNEDVAVLSEAERSRIRLMRIGFVFQRFFLLPMLTAWENVELPQAEAGVSKGDRRARTRELLEYVGLIERIAQSGMHGEVSVKLTQLGMDLDVERTRYRASRVEDELHALGEIVVAHDRDSAHHVAVSVQVFGGRVIHDVRAVIEWPLEVR